MMFLQDGYLQQDMHLHRPATYEALIGVATIVPKVASFAQLRLQRSTLMSSFVPLGGRCCLKSGRRIILPCSQLLIHCYPDCSSMQCSQLLPGKSGSIGA